MWSGSRIPHDASLSLPLSLPPSTWALVGPILVSVTLPRGTNPLWVFPFYSLGFSLTRHTSLSLSPPFLICSLTMFNLMKASHFVTHTFVNLQTGHFYFSFLSIGPHSNQYIYIYGDQYIVIIIHYYNIIGSYRCHILVLSAWKSRTPVSLSTLKSSAT